MHILFITPYVPSRIRVRSFSLIRALAREHTISLVSLVADDYEHALVQECREFCASVDVVRLPKWQAYTNCLLALPTSLPLRVAYYRSPAFISCVKTVLERQQIDLVHGELIKVVPTLRAILNSKHVPILFDSVDCISWFLQQQRDTTPHGLKRLFVSSELQKMRRYEQEALKDFDRIIITTEAERKRLAQLTGQPEKLHVIHMGVDTDYFLPGPELRQERTLVFCAKLDYAPNAQAILYFCRHVLPLIWEEEPSVRLMVVGNRPPSAVRALGADERISITGYVPDIRPYLGTAAVALAPLLVAAGMQSKILEALSQATPVVATSRCSQDLGLQDGKHLLIADEPQDYAQAILKLLNNPQFARYIGRAGRHYAVNHYSWTHAVSELAQVYDVVLATAKVFTYVTAQVRG